MLLERARSVAGGQVTVLTRSPNFTRILEGILAEWHFRAAAAAVNNEVVLVERGLDAPQDAKRVVWLSPMPMAAEPYLEVPLSLTELYHYLEKQFFQQPRHHIRLPLDQPLDLNVRGVWLVARLRSISDRGARITCPVLLPRGESLQLDFKLEGYPLRLSAEVLYEIAPGDVSGREHPQAGLIFRPLRPAISVALRQFIEKSFVERACARTGIAGNDLSLSWFKLDPNPWGALND